jgi:hypothetical protein
MKPPSLDLALLVSLLVIGVPASASAQPQTSFGPARADVHSFVLGNKLYGWCVDDGETAQAACVQYIVGVADTEAQHEMFKASPWACMPDNLTDGQLRDLVIKYLRDNPAIRHNSAANLVIFALKGAFPCPQ